MKIGVMGDTHGDLLVIKQILAEASDVEAWFHTGDYSQDATFLGSLTEKPVYSVCGNCDVYEGRSPVECIAKLEGFTIAMNHGNKYLYGVGVENLRAWGRAKNADIVLFGHTHIALLEDKDDMLLMNPGSAARPRKGLPSYGEIFLEKGTKPVANICYLD